MAMLPNIRDFNDSKHELIKIKNINDEVILFSKEEALNALVRYFSDDLDLLATGIANEKKNELDNKIAQKLSSIEKAMFSHINDKINKITENVISSIINRVIEKEVEKRVEIKLKKIKDSL